MGTTGHRSSGQYVGRIGALAFALGVGGAILALPSVASADTGRDADTPSAEQSVNPARSATRAASPGASPARSRGTSVNRAAAERPANAGPVRPAAAKPAARASRASTAAPASASPGALPDIEPIVAATETARAISIPPISVTLPVLRRPLIARPTPIIEVQQDLAEAVDNIASGTWTAEDVADRIRAKFGDLAPIADILAPYVIDGVTNWKANGTVGPQIDAVVNDPAVLGFVAALAAQGLAGYGLPTGFSTAVGDAAASLLRNVFGGDGNAGVRAAIDAVLAGPSPVTDGITGLLADPAFQQSLGAATATGLSNLVGDPAVRAVFADEIAAWLGPQLGAGAAGAIGDAVSGLLGEAEVTRVLGAATGSALTALLSQPGVADLLGGAITDLAVASLNGGDISGQLPDLLSRLSSDPALRAALPAVLNAVLAEADPAVASALGDAATTLIGRLAADPQAWSQITAQLTRLAGGNPTAATILAALSNPAVAGDLADAAGAALAAFLDYPGVSAELTAAAAPVVDAVLAGTDPSGALRAALIALQASTAVQAALGAALSSALQGLNGPTFGTTVTTLVTELVASPVLRAALADSLGGLGDVAAALLGPLGEDVAAALGPALTTLLSDPDLAGLTGDIAAAVLGGADIADALQIALQAVQADPALLAALGEAITTAANTVLDDSGIRDAIGAAAGSAIGGLLAGSPLAFLAGPATQFADAAVAALLGDPAVAGFLGDLAVNVLGGLSPEALPGAVLGLVLRDGALLGAIGFAVGQGFGSLFGDNIFGFLVGQVAGVSAALTIQAAAWFVQLTGIVPAAAAAASSEAPPVLNADPSDLEGIVAALLAPLGEDAAAVVGPALFALLADPDLAGLTEQIAVALVGGADIAEVLQITQQAVQADPALLAALGEAITTAANTVLGDSGIRESLGAVAGSAIGGLLEGSPIAVLAGPANQVTRVAVAALLANQAVAGFIGDLAVDLLGGLSPEALPVAVIGRVLRDGALQAAIGFALGQGFGSLFGDNIFGFIIGQAAGASTVLSIWAAAWIVQLTGIVPAAGAANPGAAPTAATWWLPVAAA